MNHRSVVLSLFLSFLGANLWAQQSPNAEWTILVVYHSDTGHTKALAEKVCEGIGLVEGSQCRLKSVDGVEDSDLEAYDGLVVGSPVHWATLSTPIKGFLDRVGASYFAQKRIGPDSTAASDADYRVGASFRHRWLLRLGKGNGPLCHHLCSIELALRYRWGGGRRRVWHLRCSGDDGAF